MGFRVDVPQPPDIWSGYHRSLEGIGQGIGSGISAYLTGKAKKAEEEKKVLKLKDLANLLSPPQGKQELIPQTIKDTPMQYGQEGSPTGGYPSEARVTDTGIDRQGGAMLDMPKPKYGELANMIGQLPSEQGTALTTKMMADKFAPEDYTLSEGQTRFKGDKSIASILKGPENMIGKYDPSDYTPESWQKFIQTQNPGILERYDKEKTTGLSGLIEFETVTGTASTTRGTPEYRQKYESWLKTRYPGAGSGQTVILPTAEGFAAINKQTKAVTPLGIGKPLTGEMITTQQQIGTIKDTFDRVKNLYSKDFVGPTSGRFGGLRSLTIGNPADRATFYSALQDVNNSLVYLKSGKQINEQEYERLKAAMPHKNLADSDFEARMDEFDRVLNSIISERTKNMGGYGSTSLQPIQPTQQGIRLPAGIPAGSKQIGTKNGKPVYQSPDGGRMVVE